MSISDELWSRASGGKGSSLKSGVVGFSRGEFLLDFQLWGGGRIWVQCRLMGDRGACVRPWRCMVLSG